MEKAALDARCPKVCTVTPVPRRKAGGAFTLLELLAALVIFTVLAVLLLPVFRHFQETSGSASCVNSLRQLHTAANLFANDRDGVLPSGYWMGQVGPYLGLSTSEPSAAERSRNFPVCPTARQRVLASTKSTQDPYGHDNSWIRTHSINAGLSDPEFVPPNLRLSAIPAPAETALFMDGHPEGAPYPYWRAQIRGDQVAHADGMWVHDGRLNVIYVDGHLAALRIGEVPVEAGQSRFWNPLAPASL